MKSIATEKIQSVKHINAILSAPTGELSEFAEFRWDGAGKLVSSKEPDRAIGND